MPLSQKLAESVNGLYSSLSSQFPFGPVLPRPLKDRYPADDDPELAQLLSDAAQTLKCMYQAHRDHLREGQLFNCDSQDVYCLPHKCAYCSLIVGVGARGRD